MADDDPVGCQFDRAPGLHFLVQVESEEEHDFVTLKVVLSAAEFLVVLEQSEEEGLLVSQQVFLVNDFENAVDEIGRGNLDGVEHKDPNFIKVLGGDVPDVQDILAQKVKLHLCCDFLVQHFV